MLVRGSYAKGRQKRPNGVRKKPYPLLTGKKKLKEYITDTKEIFCGEFLESPTQTWRWNYKTHKYEIINGTH